MLPSWLPKTEAQKLGLLTRGKWCSDAPAQFKWFPWFINSNPCPHGTHCGSGIPKISQNIWSNPIISPPSTLHCPFVAQSSEGALSIKFGRLLGFWRNSDLWWILSDQKPGILGPVIQNGTSGGNTDFTTLWTNNYSKQGMLFPFSNKNTTKFK